MLIIHGGTVVSATEELETDVYVDGEQIVALGSDLPIDAEHEIDATGCHVLPGGVDPHAHMQMPFGETATCDDYTTGSIAAVCGGTTSFVDFCIQSVGESPKRALDRWFARLEACEPVTDVGFHLAVTDISRPEWVDELRDLPGEGITSFKLFMAYPGTFMVEDDVMFRTMEVAADTGSLALVHAENGRVIDVLVRRALAAGQVGTRFHAATRPPSTETEATARAINLARLTGSPLYVVHVSCGEALRPIEAAQDAQGRVRAETCTQYFVAEEADLDRPNFEGGKYVFTPPPRHPRDHEHLWEGIRDGRLSVVSSDHAPFRWRDQKTLGRHDFSQIPNGAPGIEERLMIVHQLGVVGGRITMPKLVDLLATEPAKLFGLYPRKGTIAPGSDADIIVFDRSEQCVIRSAELHSNVDYSLYEGMKVQGAPRDVMVRGEVVVKDGTFLGKPGRGRFLRRGTTAA